MIPVQQELVSAPLDDVEATVVSQLDVAGVREAMQPGQRVAVAVGSRGVSELTRIVGALVSELKRYGTLPFVVPAMGSHGGANGAGQAELLAGLGIDAQTIGCPVVSSMHTSPVGVLPSGESLPWSDDALQADHVVVVNRFKPHTRITGDIQSGLIKMALVGLGKQAGASVLHRELAASKYRLDPILDCVWDAVLAQTPLRFGLGIIEDGHKQVAQVHLVASRQFRSREPELLQQANSMMPGLPFRELDLLIVDEIGKEISGTGMDTCVIGRKSNDRAAAADEWPKIDLIYVRGLSKKTQGNGVGIGIAELCHARLLRDLDANKTRINAITSGHLSAAATPIAFESDLESLSNSLGQGAKATAIDARWVRVQNTLKLNKMLCSTALLPEIEQNPSLTVIGEASEFAFNEAGDI